VLGKHLRTPLASFGLIVALIYLNQVLFTVYVIRVHHGDPSFIGRYLPERYASGGRRRSCGPRCSARSSGTCAIPTRPMTW
jgi:hypothetical protein